MPTIMTEDLSRESGQLVAVEKLSLIIDEVFGLLGPNDAGTTTTICILARLARAQLFSELEEYLKPGKPVRLIKMR